MRELTRKEGFNFAFDPNACDSCGSKCCAGERGDIWITDREIAAIAALLGEDEFAAKRFFRKAREGWLIREREGRRGFECVFLGENGCDVYSARPAQCRSFPFWAGMNERLDVLVAECAGAVL
jgi:Fe-S-cluster containining protein